MYKEKNLYILLLIILYVNKIILYMYILYIIMKSCCNKRFVSKMKYSKHL